MILVGFNGGIRHEAKLGTLTAMGGLYGVLASMFVSLSGIFTKKMLTFCDNNIWTLTFYNNCLASMLFMPLVLLFGEDMTRFLGLET